MWSGDLMARKKTEYRTVSIPKPLADKVQAIINRLGYWPSISAFVREATLEKIDRIGSNPTGLGTVAPPGGEKRTNKEKGK